MKNRLLIRKGKNGKFWCAHTWEVTGDCGPDWDIRTGVKILCTCIYCKKLKYRSNRSIKEIPDNLINPTIKYE